MISKSTVYTAHLEEMRKENSPCQTRGQILN